MLTTFSAQYVTCSKIAAPIHPRCLLLSSTCGLRAIFLLCRFLLLFDLITSLRPLLRLSALTTTTGQAMTSFTRAALAAFDAGSAVEPNL
ncbi:hypothetical protein [Micromonospora echinofusca]|uniref:hypothetical protein n=1 Tax=Micromonospora echinofusca TaxID=47858 RepID=UPI00340B7B92